LSNTTINGKPKMDTSGDKSEDEEDTGEASDDVIAAMFLASGQSGGGRFL